jgi:hypothetical protein
MDLSHTPRKAKEPWGQPDTEEEVILDQPDIEEEAILDQPDIEEEAILDQPDIEEEAILDQPSTATPSRKPQVLGEPGRGRPAPGDSSPKRPKGRRNRRKLLVTVLGALVVLAVVVNAFNPSAVSELLKKMAGLGSQQATPLPSTTPLPSSTSLPTSTPSVNGTSTALVGPLILLNPGVVRQGTSFNVMGSGFDAKATIDLVLKRQATGSTLASTFAQADKSGTFTQVTLTVPNNLPSGNFVVLAQERNSTKVAQAVGTIAGGVPQVKLGAQVAQPGDMIVFSLHGFSPGESINVYWNSMGGQPVATVQADGGGGVGQSSVQVPFGAVGTNTFLFVGRQSQALAAAPILLLALYPTVTLSSYALKADNAMSFTGKGFGPAERVFVFLNSLNGAPAVVLQSDAHGAFKRAGSFMVPYVLKGKQTLIFMGEQSRTPITVAFTVLPYTPTAMASTYGGFPGTTVSFYASGFASNEVVHVYLGHMQGASNMVSCFRTDDRGNAGAAGSYVIPGNAQTGKMVFALVGTMSGGVGLATMTIGAPPTPVQVPPQPPFTCPLDTAPTTPTTPTTPAAPEAPAAPAAPTTP